MRLNEISGGINLPDIARLIKKNCQPYLNQVSDPFCLIRGVKNGAHGTFGMQSVRLTGRKPRAMQQHQHEFINKFFTEKFGEPFRDAAFVVPRTEESENTVMQLFGTLNFAFPIGKFTFLWSPNSEDLNYEIDNSVIPMNGDEEAIKYGEHNMRSNLLYLDFRNNDLQGAVNSENEIMIRCPKIYLLGITLEGEEGFDEMREILTR